MHWGECLYLATSKCSRSSEQELDNHISKRVIEKYQEPTGINEVPGTGEKVGSKNTQNRADLYEREEW